MEIRKNASVVGSGTPNETQLAQINTFAKTPLLAQDVYSFRVRLCDDLPDRDHERFDPAALPRLAELFLGKTGIFDHNWSAKGQVARIYHTEVCADGACHYIAADCYMLRNEKNAALIAEIEGGIKKEVSVGCAVAARRCGVCGAPYGSCEHQKGASYDGTVCCAVLCEPTDAYEFSFVAVPSQREAGVLKGLKGGAWMTLDELVQKSGSPALVDRLAVLQKEAELGRRYRHELIDETVALGVALDFGASESVLKKCFASLDCEELTALKAALNDRLCARYPAACQLPQTASVGSCAIMDADYLI